MDPNELVVILDRAISNLPDPSADGRRRVYERVERTIRATCTPEGGEMDMERYQALRRDLGAAIAIIEQQRRSPSLRRAATAPAAPASVAHPASAAAPTQPASTAASATPAAVSPSPVAVRPIPVPRAASNPAAASPTHGVSVSVAPAPPEELVEPDAEDDGASPRWLKRIGIGAAATAVALGVVIAALPGGPLRSLLSGASSSAPPSASVPPPTASKPPADPFAGAQAPPPVIATDRPTPVEPAADTDNTTAFAPIAPEPGVPRVTDVKVSIMNGASEWRTERLTGYTDNPAGPPVMAIAQHRETPLLVSVYCDTPNLTVFRVAYGTDSGTLRQEIAERGSMDGIQRQRIQVKTDRNEGFAGDFLALTTHTWGIRMAPENVETLRAGKEIEISIGDAVAGTVSLSGATPAIDEALTGGSCT
ncbi:MAG: hypothetical protein P0Y66_16020 [Candidatus Kaistia colombiensis]|nr:MAG: hypothetical protein P0Y66_16020 [Kaistia sp.]